MTGRISSPIDLSVQPTLAQALAALRFQAHLDPKQIEGLSWALRKIGQAHPAGLASLAISDLEPLLENLDFSRLDLSEKSLEQMRSNARAALKAISHLTPIELALAESLAAIRAPTLADALVAVELQRIDPREKKRIKIAVERFAKRLPKPLNAIPAQRNSIDRALEGLTHTDFGIKARSWNSMRARIRRAVGLFDRKPTLRQAHLTGSWSGLVVSAEEALGPEGLDQGWRLAEIWPVVSFCFQNDILPGDVSDKTIMAMIESWERGEAKNPLNRAQRAVRGWNAIVADDLVPGFPIQRLTVPTKITKHRGIKLSGLPEPFQADFAAFVQMTESFDCDAVAAIVDYGSGGKPRGEFDDILAEASASTEKRSLVLAPSTQKNYRSRLLRAADAAIRAGILRREEIQSISTLLTPAVLAATLEAVRVDQVVRAEAKGYAAKKKSSYRNAICDTFIALGRHYGVDDSVIEKFEDMRDRVNPRVLKVTKDPKTGRKKRKWADSYMGESHARMLLQFRDEAKLIGLFDLPSELFERAKRAFDAKTLRRSHIVDFEIALTARILRNIPLRRGNVGRERILGPSPTIRLPTCEGMPALIYHSPEEVKNLVEIEAELDLETTKLLLFYIEEIRPIALKRRGSDPDNPFLFPGEGLSHKNLNKLQAQFTARCWDVGGFHLDLQCCRHLAAKIILDQDASLMGLVSQLLGHRDEKTTRRFYTKVRRLVAQRRYNAMLAERESELRALKPRWTPRYRQ